ncbi:putative conjugal transfer protein [compost metagenome]
MTARITVCFAAKGGQGRSIVAANLALLMARKAKRPPLLLDLDWLAGGSLASYLDMEPPPGNWGEVIRGTKPLSEAIATHDSGLELLAAPPAADAFAPGPRDLAGLIAQLAREHDQIVIDTSFPSLASDSARALLDLASALVVLVTPDVNALGATKAWLDHARGLRVAPERIHLVVNRTGVTEDVTLQDISEHLDRPIVAQIPYHPALLASVNRGLPLAGAQPQHPAVAAIAQLGAKALAQPPVDLGSALRGLMAMTPAAAPVSQEPISPSPQAPAAPSMAPVSTVTALVPMRHTPAMAARIADLKREVHTELVEELKRFNMSLEVLMDPRRKGEIRDQVVDVVAGILDEMSDLPLNSRAEREALITDIANEAVGLGPLERYLADPAVTEIMVNGPSKIYVERGGKLTLIPDTFTDEKQLRVVIDRIVAPLGRRVDESSPMCDARLPDGSRVNVIIPPLSLIGSTVTIRKFPERRLTVDDLMRFGALTDEMAQFVRCAVLAKLNVFISGGTGSGKTTLLNVMSGFIPSDERIVTIEDAAELQLHQEHVISLESRPPNLEGQGAIHIRDLVRNSLRMRPDRIIVGEVRGGEALDMLQAMNTGHDGSLATGHANSPRDALARLETMVLMAGVDLPVRAIREQIAAAINLIVQVSRLKDGSRKVTRISEVIGMESELIIMQDLFTFDQKTVDDEGKVVGDFRYTGLMPHAAEQFERVGLKFGPGGLR